MGQLLTATIGKLLESVQVEAARIITGLRRNSSRSCLYSELGLEPLYVRRENHKLTLIYKVLNGLCPQYMCDLIIPYLHNDSNYNLRSLGQILRTPQCRTTSYQNSFLPSTIRAWNELPSDIKNADSVEQFKRALISHRNVTKPSFYFSLGNRKHNIIMCQLRNKASGLNSHLFNHHISDSASCPNCAFSNENNYHYLFQCPAYDIHRQTFLNVLNHIPGLTVYNVDILLSGSDRLSRATNSQIFDAVIDFIEHTKRFH